MNLYSFLKFEKVHLIKHLNNRYIVIYISIYQFGIYIFKNLYIYIFENENLLKPLSLI